MDDKKPLHELATVLQAIIELQLNEVRSTRALAQALENRLPGLGAEYEAHRKEASSYTTSAMNNLALQIQKILRETK